MAQNVQKQQLEGSSPSSVIKLKIYLVRHAQTTYNKLNIIQGLLDTPLSEEGVEQTKRLGRYLAGQPFDCIVASGLERALKTAQQVLDYNVAAKNSSSRLNKVTVDDLVVERHFGAAQGKTKQYLAEEAARMGQTKLTFVPEGAETNSQIVFRWKSFMKKLCKQYILEENGKCDKEESSESESVINKNQEKNILVVTHGHFIKQVVKYLVLKSETSSKSMTSNDENNNTNGINGKQKKQVDDFHGYFDQTIPNASVSHFEFDLDLADADLMSSLCENENDEEEEEELFKLLSHVKIKCNYLNDTGSYECVN